MSDDCGPCGSGKKGKTPDMFLMAASPSSASTCGEGKTLGAAAADCTIKEPTYDRTVGAYTIPNYGTSAPIQMCNGALYSVGQWGQFVGDGSVLQITSIVGDALTLRNGCSNGARVKGNSNPGTVIPTGNAFVIVAEPACLTTDEEKQEFQNALASAEALCTPALEEEESELAEMQILGWKRADSGDSSFQKCIRRIKGIWKTAKSLYIKPIESAPLPGADGSTDWRTVVIHKTTGEVRSQLNGSENPDLEAGKKYVYMFVEGQQALIGPAYIFTPVTADLYQNYNGAMNAIDSWVNIPNGTPLEQDISLSIAAINDLTILGDDFYAHIRINIGIRQQSGYAHYATLEVNGTQVAMVGAQGSLAMNSIHLIQRILKSDKKISIKVTTAGSSGTPKMHVSAKLLGVEL
jgi:hypothetical protein